MNLAKFKPFTTMQELVGSMNLYRPKPKGLVQVHSV